MILLIDNYDSFSYNLYQLIGSVNPDIQVVRNDEISLGEIEKLEPEAIVLSPGPGRPEEAGICIPVDVYKRQLPGQFDQRADSAVQCVQFLDENAQPIIRSATTYVIEGDITEEEFEAIRNHCINPVDSRETGLQKPETLVTEFKDPEDVKIFDGFRDMEEAPLKELYSSLNLAMTFKDFLHIQNYFKNEEKRDPSMTEIRVLDTYLSLIHI